MPKTHWNHQIEADFLPKRFCFEGGETVSAKASGEKVPQKGEAPGKLAALKSKLTSLKGRMKLSSLKGKIERNKLQDFEAKLQGRLEQGIDKLTPLDKDYLLYKLLDQMVDNSAKGKSLEQWFGEEGDLKNFMKGKEGQYPQIVGRSWEQLRKDGESVKETVMKVRLGLVPEKVVVKAATKPSAKPSAKTDTKSTSKSAEKSDGKKSDWKNSKFVKTISGAAGTATKTVTKWVSKVTKGKVDLSKGVNWVKKNPVEAIAIVAGAVGITAFLTRWRSMGTKGKLAAGGSIATLGLAIAGKRIGKEKIAGWFKKNLNIDMDSDKLKKIVKTVTTGKLADLPKIISGEKKATKDQLKALKKEVEKKQGKKAPAKAAKKAPEKAPEKASAGPLKSTVLLPSAPSDNGNYIRFRVSASDITWRVSNAGTGLMMQEKDGSFKAPTETPKFQIVSFLKDSEDYRNEMTELLGGRTDSDFKAKFPRVLVTLQQKEIATQNRPQNIPKVIREATPALIEFKGDRQKLRKELLQEPEKVLERIRKYIKKETKAEGKNK